MVMETRPTLSPSDWEGAIMGVEVRIEEWERNGIASSDGPDGLDGGRLIYYVYTLLLKFDEMT